MFKTLTLCTATFFLAAQPADLADRKQSVVERLSEELGPNVELVETNVQPGKGGDYYLCGRAKTSKGDRRYIAIGGVLVIQEMPNDLKGLDKSWKRNCPNGPK